MRAYLTVKPTLTPTTTWKAAMKTSTQQANLQSRTIQGLCKVLITVCLGLLLTQPAHALVGEQTSGFEYDSATGLLLKEIIEPDDSNLCLVKEYQYDNYGNRKQTTTRNCNGSTGEAAAPAAGSDAEFVARVEKSDYTYNADGSYQVVNTKVVDTTLSLIETIQIEATFGNMTSLTGPNNLTTYWEYETFGRKQLETRPDLTATHWIYTLQTGIYAPQPNIAYFIATAVDGLASPTYDYYDMLNRKVLTQRRAFDGVGWIDDGNTVYNDLGQVLNSYLPYEASNFSNAKFSTTEYDLLGRVKTQTAPDLSVTNIAYSGLTTVETNDLGQTKTTGRDEIGQVEYIMDTQNKIVSFLYDPFGNLTASTDALGNDIILTYDNRGRKETMVDPDMGTWSYFYNAVGELVRQKDADPLHSPVTITYDTLGRIKMRNESDLISTWIYDTAVNGKGKIASVSSDNGYSRTYSYDTLSRLTSTATVIDNPVVPYVTGTGYDQYGRVETQTYPTGFAIQNIYTTEGYLGSVVDANATSTVFWTANTEDPMGHVTQQTYGSGVATIQQVYDPATGRLQQQLDLAGGAIQNTTYQFDTLGNLKTRTDVANNLTEIYDYDTLSRIKTATATSGTISTVNTYDYDAIGNLKLNSKQDNNGYLYNYSYTYNPSGSNSVQPHAVASIVTLTGTIYGVSNPGYIYDPNGNMQTGAGRTVTWTSFNMPSTMQGCPGGGTTCSSISFVYNADHEWIRQVQADQSVIIALSPRYDTGLHFEKKYLAANGVLTGAIEYDHTLYAGGIMFGHYVTTTATDGVTIDNAKTRTEYYVKDHLGSVVARLDNTGAIIERLSYDVFGKRRYPDGANDPNGLLNNPDMYHGYTSHEMLDAVGFIHMNGRIYDPSIGRFLSTDPTVPHPRDGQSFNRYSYVMNNPLSLNDPSGFSDSGSGYGDNGDWCGSTCQTMMNKYHNFLATYGIGAQVNNPANQASINIEEPNYGTTNNTLDLSADTQETPVEKTIVEKMKDAYEGTITDVKQAATEAIGNFARSKFANMGGGHMHGQQQLDEVNGITPEERQADDTERANEYGNMTEEAAAPIVSAGVDATVNIAGIKALGGVGGVLKNWKSVKQFGHTFNDHGAGARNMKRLIDRARGTGTNQGQWLNNEKAAKVLSANMVNGPATVRIPQGLGQVIRPDGTIVPAEWARIVPSGNGLRTAFPVVP